MELVFFLDKTKIRISLNFFLIFLVKVFFVAIFLSFYFLFFTIAESRAENFCYKFITRKNDVNNLLEDKKMYDNCLYGSDLGNLGSRRNKAPIKPGDIPIVELQFQRLFPITPIEGDYKYPILPKQYNPRADVNYRYGNTRSLGRTELFIPIWQNIDNLVFADLALMSDNNNSKESNFGIGYRKLFKNRFIFGSYGFYDKASSPSGNDITQLTLGMELLTRDLDFRFNLYLPDEKLKQTSKVKAGEAIALRGNDMIASGGSFEAALAGFDFEFGFKLPYPLDELTLTNGIAHFSNSKLDQEINRFNSRLDYVIFENDNHKLNLNLEYIYQVRKNDGGVQYVNNVRFNNNSYYFGAIYSYFFGKGNSLIGPLQKRMVGRVIRDLDIVTDGKAGTESKIADVYYITNETQTISDLINQAPENAAIVIKAKDDGSSYNESVILNKAGHKVYGLTHENPLRFGSTDKSICNFLACKDSKPIINGGVESAFRVNADNNAIGNFIIHGNSASKSVFITGNNYKIDNNNFTGDSDGGIFSFGNTGKGVITSNSFEGKTNPYTYMIDVLASSKTDINSNYFNSSSMITNSGLISLTSNDSNPITTMKTIVQNNRMENLQPTLVDALPIKLNNNNTGSRALVELYNNVFVGHNNIINVDTDGNGSQHLDLFIRGNSYQNIGPNKLNFNSNNFSEITSQSGNGLDMTVISQ